MKKLSLRILIAVLIVILGANTDLFAQRRGGGSRAGGSRGGGGRSAAMNRSPSMSRTPSQSRPQMQRPSGVPSQRPSGQRLQQGQGNRSPAVSRPGQLPTSGPRPGGGFLDQPTNRPATRPATGVPGGISRPGTSGGMNRVPTRPNPVQNWQSSRTAARHAQLVRIGRDNLACQSSWPRPRRTWRRWPA